MVFGGIRGFGVDVLIGRSSRLVSLKASRPHHWTAAQVSPMLTSAATA
jgi:hypothetical protein